MQSRMWLDRRAPQEETAGTRIGFLADLHLPGAGLLVREPRPTVNDWVTRRCYGWPKKSPEAADNVTPAGQLSSHRPLRHGALGELPFGWPRGRRSPILLGGSSGQSHGRRGQSRRATVGSSHPVVGGALRVHPRAMVRQTQAPMGKATAIGTSKTRPLTESGAGSGISPARPNGPRRTSRRETRSTRPPT